MSRPQFASISADLLARKGEARPWNEPAILPPTFGPPPVMAPAVITPPAAWQAQPLPPAPEPAPAHATLDCKKISVRLSHHDYERLGILAVKQNSSRQKLLQEALDRLLSGMPQQFGGNCACLAGEKTR